MIATTAAAANKTKRKTETTTICTMWTEIKARFKCWCFFFFFCLDFVAVLVMLIIRAIDLVVVDTLYFFSCITRVSSIWCYCVSHCWCCCCRTVQWYSSLKMGSIARYICVREEHKSSIYSPSFLTVICLF